MSNDRSILKPWGLRALAKTAADPDVVKQVEVGEAVKRVLNKPPPGSIGIFEDTLNRRGFAEIAIIESHDRMAALIAAFEAYPTPPAQKAATFVDLEEVRVAGQEIHVAFVGREMFDALKVIEALDEGNAIGKARGVDLEAVLRTLDENGCSAVLLS